MKDAVKMKNAKKDGTEKKILGLVKKFYKENYKSPAENRIPASGKVYDEKELQNLVKCALEGWWTESSWSIRFEEKLKGFLGVKFALAVNSGSSANLIALKTLTSPKLGDRTIRRGDEIITTAAAFPTTVNPIIEIGAMPVMVDVDIPGYNANIKEIGQAITPKTKAIFMAHTLGNPFDLKKIRELCDKNNLWLIEDNCDSLGSRYDGKYTGTFGNLATLSFYPAHHITTAEGGAVLTSNKDLYRIARSIRDWGRDCWCPTGKDNSCGKRFSWKLGGLPYGYDHKYIYSEIGYNMKMTDLQASIGLAQMDKINCFMKKRKENFRYLHKKMKELDGHFILPEATEGSDPCWFGFMLTIRDKNIDRMKLLEHLNRNNIGTRLLFAGNITKQPYFIDNKIEYRKASDLKNTDRIMNDSFWVGIYPALGKKHLNMVFKKIKEFIDKR